MLAEAEPAGALPRCTARKAAAVSKPTLLNGFTLVICKCFPTC